MDQLPGVFGTVAPFLDDYGYAAVALFVLLENIGLLVPGEAVVVTAALFAGTGRLDLSTVALVAFAAATIGDNIGYAIGRFGGRPLVLRVGRHVGLTPARLDAVESFFVRHGVGLVVVARFLPLLRHGNGIAAGTSSMPWRRFLAANAVGAALWASVWTLVGRAGSPHLDRVDQVLRAGFPLALGLLLLALLVMVLRSRRRRRAGTVVLAEPLPNPSSAPSIP